MTKFEQAYIEEETIMRLRASLLDKGIRPEVADQLLVEEVNGKFFVNDKYQVRITEENQFYWHLSIKRLDKEPIHDWRDLQRIKNELIGEEYEAVELYPAESRLVDAANQYHLYAFRDPNVRFQFGYTERGVSEDTFDNSKQRKFDEEEM
jgi:hypothetical protein